MSHWLLIVIVSAASLYFLSVLIINGFLFSVNIALCVVIIVNTSNICYIVNAVKKSPGSADPGDFLTAFTI